MTRSTRVGAAVMVGVLAVGACACSSSGDDAGSSQTTALGPTSTAVSQSTAAGATTTPSIPTSDSALGGSTVAPEPTGVPGVDDEDEFCAGWARYSGTLQALGVASAFGGLTPVEMARLEVIAAPSLVVSAADIDATWPAELDDEREVVVDDLVGPFVRRSQKAIDALTAAGATEGDLDALRSAWLDALRARHGENPVIEVPAIPDDLAAIVDAAAAAFDASVTPFADDPSLVTESVEAPATDAYLAEHCPDLASSGVGDAI